VFKEHSQPEVEAADEEEVTSQKNEAEDVLTGFKHVFVKEVVREPRMHY
jgi:hypothetical protein